MTKIQQRLPGKLPGNFKKDLSPGVLLVSAGKAGIWRELIEEKELELTK